MSRPHAQAEPRRLAFGKDNVVRELEDGAPAHVERALGDAGGRVGRSVAQGDAFTRGFEDRVRDRRAPAGDLREQGLERGRLLERRNFSGVHGHEDGAAARTFHPRGHAFAARAGRVRARDDFILAILKDLPDHRAATTASASTPTPTESTRGPAAPPRARASPGTIAFGLDRRAIVFASAVRAEYSHSQERVARGDRGDGGGG